MSSRSLEHASDGEEALEKLRAVANSAFPPIMCVVDVIMPGLSGVKLMKAIREVIPELRFMLITGYAGIPEVAAMEREGVVEVFLKPFRIDDMIAKISFVMSNTQRIPVQ